MNNAVKQSDKVQAAYTIGCSIWFPNKTTKSAVNFSQTGGMVWFWRPLTKKYILLVAKDRGANLVSFFISEFTNIFSKKKRFCRAMGGVMKKLATKKIVATQAQNTEARRNGEGQWRVCGAASGRWTERRRESSRGHGPAKVIGAYWMEKPSQKPEFSSASWKFILIKNPAKRSRSDN